jgi:hypothetical protein
MSCRAIMAIMWQLVEEGHLDREVVAVVARDPEQSWQRATMQRVKSAS